MKISYYIFRDPQWRHLLISNVFLLLICACSGPYPKSDHYDGKIFFNPGGPELKSIKELIKWKLQSKAADWPDQVENKNYPFPKYENGRGVVTFINHATFLLQLSGVNVLTDPIFSQRAGPFQSFGPVKRVRPPGIRIDDLPKIDVVIISHNHYDHLDKESVLLLEKKFKPLFLVPLGDKKFLIDWGVSNVKELDWWNEVKHNGLRIVFTPVQHWSARGVMDKNKSLWGGYFIYSSIAQIYFGGDAGYSPRYVETKQRLGSPDISLIPIGAYEPRWFMKDHHMNPEEAIKAHLDLGSKVSFGMHFGTFKLTDEAYDQPVIDLEKARIQFLLTEDQFRVLDFGESYLF